MVQAMAELALRKARESFEKRSYESAIAQCKEALALVDKEMSGADALRLRAAVLLLLADVNDVIGQWVDSLLYLDGVTQISVGLGDAKLGVESLIQAGRIISKKGKWADALKKFERAEALSTKQGMHRLLGRALVGKGIILWRLGQYDDAIREGERAAKMATSIGDEQLVGSAHALIASVRFDQGNYKEAIEANGKALRAFEIVKDAYEMARVLNNLGETYKVMGDYATAIQQLERCLKIAEESDNKRNAGYALMNIAECKVRLGETPAAKVAASKADTIFAGLEDKYAHANMAIVWGLVHASKGDGRAALSSFERGVEVMTALKIPYDTGVALMEFGLALKRFGEPQKARTMLAKAVRSFDEAGAKAMKVKAEEELAVLPPA
jgi:tetratricopeptide (TPR) repeat protein